MSSPKPASSWARRRNIQLPYPNTCETIWEYKESFLSRRIDFFSFLGPTCPVCGKQACYRQITPYWRYAIELFPEFKKERIPIARFVCRRRWRTFSPLPIQLIPYFKYTVNAVMGTLLLGIRCRQMRQRGFHGASVGVDPESLLTPWLVACWLAVVVQGFRRAHGVLRRFYDLSAISSYPIKMAWEEVRSYLLCFRWKPEIRWGPTEVIGPPTEVVGPPWLQALLNRYSRSTRLFLFGTPSQQRAPMSPSHLYP